MRMRTFGGKFVMVSDQVVADAIANMTPGKAPEPKKRKTRGKSKKLRDACRLKRDKFLARRERQQDRDGAWIRLKSSTTGKTIEFQV